jgi:hypothetical protein
MRKIAIIIAALIALSATAPASANQALCLDSLRAVTFVADSNTAIADDEVRLDAVGVKVPLSTPAQNAANMRNLSSAAHNAYVACSGGNQ